MSVKPSAHSNSSATYCGATHKLGLFTSLMVVTSGGASWASEFGLPRRPAAPKDESVARKRRRFWIVGMACLPFTAWHASPLRHEIAWLVCIESRSREVTTICKSGIAELTTASKEPQCLPLHRAGRHHSAGPAQASPAEAFVNGRLRPSLAA